MSRWFRSYDDALDDPKVQRLPGDLFKAWFNLMCVTSKNGGRPFDLDEVVFRLRVTPTKAQAVIDALIERKLIDVVEGKFVSHNWDVRQFKTDGEDRTNAERQKRYREKHSNGKSNGVTPVTVTSPRTEQNTEQSSEPEGSGAEAPPDDPKTQLFARGRKVLGKGSGGLIAKLLRSFGSEDDPRAIAKARARIEEASTKANAVEWLNRVLVPKDKAEFRLMSGMEGVV